MEVQTRNVRAAVGDYSLLTTQNLNLSICLEPVTPSIV